MKFLNLAFIYSKSMTLCVTSRFNIQKARHFAKSNAICNTFLYTKIRHSCVTRFFIEFLKFAEWGGTDIDYKTINFAWHFYIEKTMHFVLRCYIQRAWHYALYFNIQKTIHFSFRFYIYNLSCSPDT